MRYAALALSLGAALCTVPALAQQPSGCSDFKWPVDHELSAFAAGSVPTIENGMPIPGPGSAVTLKLTDQSSADFAVPPTHKPKHNPAYAGSFPLPADMVAGSYQVTLAEDAWIDVMQGGKLLRQTGFTASHTCPVVRKSVRFDLTAGPATLEISDASGADVKVEVRPVAVP